MKWHKGKITGNEGKVRGVTLNVYQIKLKKTVIINRPIQLRYHPKSQRKHQNPQKQ